MRAEQNRVRRTRVLRIPVRKIVAGLAAVLIGFGGAVTTVAPATAGGWAATLLDPLPERLEPQRAYTVGFWVLQHGVRPLLVDGALFGLKLVGTDGQSHQFAGVALPEPGHYAATVVIPSGGHWRVLGVQGGFEDFEVGTIRAPGSLTVFAVPAAPEAESREWSGLVRPPVVPVDRNRNPFEPVTELTGTGERVGAPPAGAVGEELLTRAERQAVDTVAQEASGGGIRLGTLLLVVVAILAAAVFPVAYLRRSGSRTGIPPETS